MTNKILNLKNSAILFVVVALSACSNLGDDYQSFYTRHSDNYIKNTASSRSILSAIGTCYGSLYQDKLNTPSIDVERFCVKQYLYKAKNTLSPEDTNKVYMELKELKYEVPLSMDDITQMKYDQDFTDKTLSKIPKFD